jgi:hypothetical protein
LPKKRHAKGSFRYVFTRKSVTGKARAEADGQEARVDLQELEAGRVQVLGDGAFGQHDGVVGEIEVLARTRAKVGTHHGDAAADRGHLEHALEERGDVGLAAEVLEEVRDEHALEVILGSSTCVFMPTTARTPGAASVRTCSPMSTAQRSPAGTALMNSHAPAAGSSTLFGLPNFSATKLARRLHVAIFFARSTSRNRYW